MQQDYRAVGYSGEPPPPPEAIGASHFPAEAAEFLSLVRQRLRSLGDPPLTASFVGSPTIGRRR